MKALPVATANGRTDRFKPHIAKKKSEMLQASAHATHENQGVLARGTGGH